MELRFWCRFVVPLLLLKDDNEDGDDDDVGDCGSVGDNGEDFIVSME